MNTSSSALSEQRTANDGQRHYLVSIVTSLACAGVGFWVSITAGPALFPQYLEGATVPFAFMRYVLWAYLLAWGSSVLGCSLMLRYIGIRSWKDTAFWLLVFAPAGLAAGAALLVLIPMSFMMEQPRIFFTIVGYGLHGVGLGSMTWLARYLSNKAERSMTRDEEEW